MERQSKIITDHERQPKDYWKTMIVYELLSNDNGKTMADYQSIIERQQYVVELVLWTIMKTIDQKIILIC